MVGELHIGHWPRPLGKASRRSELTSAYCKLEPHILFAVAEATHGLSVSRQREKLTENKVIDYYHLADSAQEGGQVPVDSNQHG